MARAIRTCANCGAWQEPAAEEEMGTCRLEPPHMTHDGSYGFPSAPPHWWCAKWINQRRLNAVTNEEA